MSIVFQGRVFSVEVDRARFPDGREHQVEIVRHRPSVVLLPMPDPDHVILIRQYRHTVGREIWELPAGSLNEGETAEAAARRECEEEIRLVPARLHRIVGLYPAPGFCDEELIFFHASELQPAAPDSPHQPDEDESIDPKTFPVGEALAMVANGAIVDLKTAYGLTLLSR